MSQSPCCARRVSQLNTARADLAVLAHRAAVAHGKNRSIERYKAQIEKAKAVVAEQRQAQIDHEAEHAGEAVA